MALTANERNLLTRVDLALSQVKRVEREVRIVKQMLGGIRDDLRSEEDARNGTAQDQRH